MEGNSMQEMIDICNLCDGFLKKEVGLIATIITALIAVIVRKFEKKNYRKK